MDDEVGVEAARWRSIKVWWRSWWCCVAAVVGKAGFGGHFGGHLGGQAADGQRTGSGHLLTATSDSKSERPAAHM